MVFYIWSFFIVLVYLFPYYWELVTSLKPPEELYRMPPLLYPTKLYLGHFWKALYEKNLLVNIKNSAIVATSTTILIIFIGSLAAYTFSRYRFKGRDAILSSLLVISMLSPITIVGPLFVLLSRLHLIDSYLGLIFPYSALHMTFGIWSLVSFFKQIPVELDEAGLVDGCSRFQTMLKVVFPLAAPGIFSVGFIIFMLSWNEFFFALNFTRTNAARTTPVAIVMFMGLHEVPWGEMSAAAIFITFPIIIMAVFLQKRIIQGLTAGALKG